MLGVRMSCFYHVSAKNFGEGHAGVDNGVVTICGFEGGFRAFISHKERLERRLDDDVESEVKGRG